MAETNKTIKFTYKVIDESGNVVEQTTSKLSDLQKAVSSTQEALKNADIGSAKWKELKDSVEDNEKALGKAQVKSDGLFNTLAKSGGPIGTVVSGFQGMGKAAMAFVANPIGAVIAALGLAFTGIYKALTSTEKGMFALNKIFGAFSGIISAVVKPLGEIAAILGEKLAASIEFVLSGLEALGLDFAKSANEGAKLAQSLNEIEEAEGDLAVARAQQNKELAVAKELLTDTNASYKDRKAALDQIKIAEEALAAQELALAKKTLKAAQDRIALQGKSKENLDAEEAALIKLAQTEEAYAAKQRQFNKEEKKLKAEAEAKDKEIAAANKKRQEEYAANRKAALDKIRSLEEENALLREQDEEKRALKAQEFANAQSVREINSMKLTAEEKKKLLAEAETNNQLEVAKIQEDFRKKREEKEKEDLAKRKQNADDIKDALATSAEELRDRAIEKETERFDELIKLAGDDAEKRKQLEAQKAENLIKINDDYNKKIAEDNKVAAEKALADKIAEIDAKAKLEQAYLNVIDQAAGFISEIAGENKKLQIAGLVVGKAAAIGSIISNTAAANAKSVATFPATLGQPWVGINTASAALSIASVIASSIKAINEINSADTETGGQGSAPTAKPSTYLDGGLLTGRRHANGGIATPMGELEGGEFVVNRAATSSFLPILESINSMGVGRNGGQNNLGSNIENSMTGSNPVFKTYVVASDVTSQQEADKRIQDLAKL
jgi:hypothetical protein